MSLDEELLLSKQINRAFALSIFGILRIASLVCNECMILVFFRSVPIQGTSFLLPGMSTEACQTLYPDFCFKICDYSRNFISKLVNDEY